MAVTLNFGKQADGPQLLVYLHLCGDEGEVDKVVSMELHLGYLKRMVEACVKLNLVEAVAHSYMEWVSPSVPDAEKDYVGANLVENLSESEYYSEPEDMNGSAFVGVNAFGVVWGVFYHKHTAGRYETESVTLNSLLKFSSGQVSA